MRPLTLLTLTLLAACSTSTRDVATTKPAPPSFPLVACPNPDRPECVVRATPYLVDDPDAERGGERKLGARFLELWDEKVRDEICSIGPNEARKTDCLTHLAELNAYLNPGGKRVPDNAIGVALEGGGSKAAPFALGVLAGLNEANLFHEGRIGAVSSVSGGSYAASFLFNRLWDYYSLEPRAAGALDSCRRRDPTPEEAKLRIETTVRGHYDAWFRSCVPDAYTRDDAPLRHMRDRLPLCGELRKPEERDGTEPNEFHHAYRYQGHVWRYPDLLFGDEMAMLKQDRIARFPEAAQTAGLTIASAGTVPLQFVSRTLFRWPINTAPTKNVYRYGLERQFGFSPEDWQEAQQRGADITEVSAERRRERTLACLGTLLPRQGAPTWILNSSTPGPTTVVDWLTTPRRDPMINSFELTAAGYGSGLYGYARMPPRFRFELDGYRYTPRDMSMTDGVVASAAFFDNNQSLLSDQPTRLFLGSFQYLLNLTWFTDIPNYNASRPGRVGHNATPYPFWGIPAGDKHKSAYIHLQDGGNSENSGIFALLRRGYRTIVFAHGTYDQDAQFPSLCHLKNVLELYGAYRIDSDQFHEVATRLAASNGKRFERKDDDSRHVFRNYLDQLCSYELDESTRGQFASEEDGKVSPLSRVYCTRLQRHDAENVVCPEYKQRFPTDRSTAAWDVPKTWADPERMFFRWTGTSMKFHVYRTRDCPLNKTITACDTPEPLATIVVITPAIAWTDFKSQLAGSTEIDQAADWNTFCTMGARRKWVRINACSAPARPGESASSNTRADEAIPCTAAAYLMADACRPDGTQYVKADGALDHKLRQPIRRAPITHVPEFPQDNFIWTTWNSSYLMFAAYFDLGRHYARRATTQLPPAAFEGLPHFTANRNPP